MTGPASAHFPEGLKIDIKPGSDDNPINPRSPGLISVAVLQSDEFEPPSEEDPYHFGAPDVVSAGGGAQPDHEGHVEDVNGDGRYDLVLHFPTEATGFKGDESVGRLERERTRGENTGCPAPIMFPLLAGPTDSLH